MRFVSGHNGRGTALSAETRSKISASHCGKTMHPAQAAALLAANMGRSLSGSHRARLSAALMGKPKSAEHAARISAGQRGVPRPHQRGANNGAWKGGTSYINDRWDSHAYDEWRKAVKTRDKWRCRHCGRRTQLHAHHVRGWTSHPEMRFDVSNGLTLCRSCHQNEHARLRALTSSNVPTSDSRRLSLDRTVS
jgi:hypothetical protein